eukprot:gnl/TRDRNA2_/TRDRNA2_73117_c0_seq1.p2 gnl/TRDRNA2_/TRDRNA2_73117_c0~~gnl/TRDRNA2_/TRDRNA2_73117_c0_seq1.p2  ORF type:complete len:183 (+),score=33.54 gnl/TRDRNA2_/TRDRNA2_73117_c0_seq1:56-550(+)
MGNVLEDCRERCDEECDRERKCYVDQNEVKIGAFDVMSYPQGTKINPAIGQHSLVSDLAAAMPGNSTRSNATSSDWGRRDRLKPRMKPQSVSWAEGLVRQSAAIMSRFQLTPKAASFAPSTTQREMMTFEQQMSAARQGGGGHPMQQAPQQYGHAPPGQFYQQR